MGTVSPILVSFPYVKWEVCSTKTFYEKLQGWLRFPES